MIVSATSAQFKSPMSVSFFSGWSIAQQNGYNQGYWYGGYLDYALIQTKGFLGGIAAVASQSDFKSNDTRSSYHGESSSVGGGFFLGKYTNYFREKTDSYIGFNALLKKEVDIGNGVTLLNEGHGDYAANQTDLLLSSELNLNLLKRPKNEVDSTDYNPNLFPRTQVRLVIQQSLKTEKNSTWNGNPISESLVWSKAAYVGEIRQSLYQFGKATVFEPKLMSGYNYYHGNKSHWFLTGLELGIKNPGKDSFLSLYFFVKQQVGNYEANWNSRQFIVGLNFSPSNLLLKN